MTGSAVTFQRVTKKFNRLSAVDGLDLDIPVGQTVALLGANGAGKSTSVNMMLGLLRPTSGRVEVLGLNPEKAVTDGRIAAMLQDGGLLPGVSVAGMVELARSMYRKPKPLARLLADADLTSLARRRVDRLSGGQTQRVRYAVAAAGDPDVLVLDEPTSAMDVESRRTFWSGIRTNGKTVLFATHYLEEADENADRIVVIAHGRIVADGTPAQVKAAAGGHTVRFTLGEDSARGLDTLPAVTAVEVRGRTALLRTTDTEQTVRALFGVRAHVPDLEVSGADLEDAVLALTGAQR